MSTQKNAINWFEIPVSDFERAKNFYSALLNYEMPTHQMGDDLMGFFPSKQEADAVGGAIVKGDGYEPGGSGPIVYLNGGDDLQVILDRVEPSGGSVHVPKTFITKEIGYFAFFHDTEGNRVALHSRN